MVAYIKELAEQVSSLLDPFKIDSSIESRLRVLAEELDRLDPRDFLPSVRASFVNLRRVLAKWLTFNENQWDMITTLAKAAGLYQLPIELKRWADWVEIPPERRHVFREGEQQVAVAAQELLRAAKAVCDQISSALDSYGGPGSQAVSRSFGWVKNSVLRQIVERDYRELTLINFPAGAWKSAVVLAGSILEAILYDQLTRTPSRIKNAMKATEAPPKSKGGPIRDLKKNSGQDEWSLENLIKVAAQLSLIEQEETDLTHQALRKYRNFIHPSREKREEKALSEGEATAALGALMVICDHLERES